MKALAALPPFFRGEAQVQHLAYPNHHHEARLKRRKDRRPPLRFHRRTNRPTIKETLSPRILPIGARIPSEELQRKELREALKRALDSLSSEIS